MNTNSLPSDFDYKLYLAYNPDLIRNGIINEALAIKHYLLFGIKENRTYKKPLLLKDPIDIDFDSSFYLSEYPDVATYYRDAKNIPQDEKLFHHYLNYGKNEGRFKNKKEQDQALVDINDSVFESLSKEDLIAPKNTLESICLLTTDKEIKNGQFNKFLRQFLHKTKKNNITQNIDFKIIVNRKINHRLIELSSFRKIFANTDIVDLNLSMKDDIYTTSISPKKKLPKYGLKSGPNLMFFQTMQKQDIYNTTLLLETDCYFGTNWIENLYNYTKYSNGFFVSGALYDGNVFTKAGSAMMNHINGGTALYATGNHVFQKIILILSHFLQKQIANNMPGLAYDYAFKLLIDHNINNTYDDTEKRLIWQFINRNYLPSKLIINCSTDSDSSLDKDILMQKYNYSILHKK